MKALRAGLLCVVCMVLLVPAASASTLGSKSNELAFDFSYVDAKDVSKDTTLTGHWGWIFGKGYSELGAFVQYQKLDFGPSGGSSTTASLFGPEYTFNFMPDNKAATLFVSVAIGTVGGDLNDFFDTFSDLGFGVKLFAGDSAAVRVRLFSEKLKGKNNFSDQDSSGLEAGVSFFFGRK